FVLLKLLYHPVITGSTRFSTFFDGESGTVQVGNDKLLESSIMPFSGIIMESNFYKACLRPMGASAPTYCRACSPNRPCIWIVSSEINKLY
ncbi:MAG: hypothetical protein J7J07_01165, partial [Syntrophobacterales bacterium]|nr:hypothetical protein [Syntrophobacterales bacterium]